MPVEFFPKEIALMVLHYLTPRNVFSDLALVSCRTRIAFLHLLDNQACILLSMHLILVPSTQRDSDADGLKRVELTEAKPLRRFKIEGKGWIVGTVVVHIDVVLLDELAKNGRVALYELLAKEIAKKLARGSELNELDGEGSDRKHQSL